MAERQESTGVRRTRGGRVDRRRVFGLAGGLALTLGGAARAWAQDASPVADPVASEAPDAQTPSFEGTPAPRRGELTVYSGRSENLVGPILNRFDQVSGITTEVRYASTGELAATLLEEGTNTPASAFFAQDGGALGLLAREGRFQPLPQELLDRVPERFRSPEGLWVGVTGRARVLVYNTDVLTEADLPSSVFDLTDPAWQGRLGWAPENASFQAFITAMRVLEGEEATRAWLEAMIANGTVNFGDSNTAIVRATGEGEIDAGLVNHYYLFAVKKEEGQDFPIANHYLAPDDPGSLINVAGIGVLQDSQNPDAAVELVDYLLSPEAQEYFAAQTSEYPLVEGVQGPEGLTPIEEIGGPDIDLSDLADLQETLALLAEVGLL